MQLVTLDFETFFADDYTLSDMTTEAYVRDPRFKVHMVGLKESGEKPFVMPRPYTQYDPLLLDTNAVICHHAHFDGLILSHHYNIRPAFWFDTLSMARLVFPHAKSHSLGALAEMLDIGKKNIDYVSFKNIRDLPPDLYARIADGCANDCEMTHAVFKAMLPYVPKDELRIIDLTVRMFTEPALRLDRPRMEWYAKTLAAKKENLLAQLGVTKKMLGSNPQFAALLVSLGEEPETKPGKNGPIFAFAKNDNYMRGLLESDNEQLAMLAEARIDTKSTGSQSRAQRMLDMDTRGAMCVYINYAGAHTLRDSGGDSMNWQNFKRIDFDENKAPLEGLEQRGHIRLSIVAPPGYQVVVVDSSQIECIAEGQLVLTDNGAKAIQDVKLTDSVWDGQEFVKHEGVIYKGIQKVISYGGITATPEHNVYLGSHSGAKAVPLSIAAALGLNIQEAGKAATVCQTSLRKPYLPRIQNLRRARDTIQLCQRRASGTMGMGAFTASRLCGSRDRQEGQRRTLCAEQLTAGYTQAECQQSVHNVLGGNGRWKSISYERFSASVPRVSIWTRPNTRVSDTGFNRRADKHTFSARALEKYAGTQQKEARVYDIVNCGPRYRFMVNGVVVSNCRLLNWMAGQQDVLDKFAARVDIYSQLASMFYSFEVTKKNVAERGTGKQLELSCGYGAGGETIVLTAKLGIYGPPVQLSPEQGKAARDLYRATHPQVVALWKYAGKVILPALLDGQQDFQWGPVRVWGQRLLGPDGTWLDYSNLRYGRWFEGQERDEFHTLARHGGAKKMYGAKLIENVVQYLGRAVLMKATLGIAQRYRTVLRTHDEVVYLAKTVKAPEALAYGLEIMKTPPDWCAGIPLDAEGGYDVRYSK